MMKITIRKVGKGHNKKACSRPLWCERKERAGRGKVMNGRELFCFCCLLYTCCNRKRLKLTGRF
jgi:hypothetical protein